MWLIVVLLFIIAGWRDASLALRDPAIMRISTCLHENLGPQTWKSWSIITKISTVRQENLGRISWKSWAFIKENIDCSSRKYLPFILTVSTSCNKISTVHNKISAFHNKIWTIHHENKSQLLVQMGFHTSQFKPTFRWIKYVLLSKKAIKNL